MKIEKNDEITAFLARTRNNISDTAQNAFLDTYVTRDSMHAVQKKLKHAGEQEFDGPKDTWPSLFLSTKQWLQNPYMKAIHLEDIHDAHFSYEKEWVEAGWLFNADAVQPDRDHELKDWMKLRAMDEDYQAVYLFQDEKDWMMAAPSEAATNDPCALKAHGNVITFGLGIGYFIFMAMQNPKVDSITVVEKSRAVIEMFEQYLKPQFPSRIPLHLIHGDASSYFNAEYLKQFDYCYCDIWQSSDDGLKWMMKLLEQYNPPVEDADFWIEDSIIVPLRTLMDLHFEELVYQRKNAVNPAYGKLMKKVRRYFAESDEIIHDSLRLKQLLYDRSTLRKILAWKI